MPSAVGHLPILQSCHLVSTQNAFSTLPLDSTLTTEKGADILFKLVRHMRQNTFFEFTRELLDNTGRTVELNIPGGRLLLTDNIENIKAIQFTQVDSLACRRENL